MRTIPTGRTINLSRLDDLLEELSYPATDEEVVESAGDVTIELADGETTLAEVMAWTESEQFWSADDLEDEVYGVLPIEAVGEPHQSEGKG